MLEFVADPRDGYSAGGACGACCCQDIRMKPGETNLLRIVYAGWAIPMAFRGLSVNTWFDITRLTPSVAPGVDNGAPVLGSLKWTTATIAPIMGDLATEVSDPEGEVLTFALLPNGGTTKGTLDLDADGTFMYTPNVGSNPGTDHFYFTATDPDGNSTVGQASLGVLLPIDDVEHAPQVDVLRGRKKLGEYDWSMSVPVAIGMDAKVGDVWRLNVRQEAWDCDGGTYYHVSCYDIHIVKC